MTGINPQMKVFIYIISYSNVVIPVVFEPLGLLFFIILKRVFIKFRKVEKLSKCHVKSNCNFV